MTVESEPRAAVSGAEQEGEVARLAQSGSDLRGSRPRGALFVRGGAFAAIDAFGKLVALAVVAVLTRRESRETFGLVVAGLAGASVVQTITDGGLGLALASAVARGDRSSHEITGAKVTLCVAIGVPALCGSLALPAQLAVPAAALTSGAASALIPVSALVAGHRFVYGATALVGPNILFLLLVLCLPSMDAADLLLVFAATNTVCAAVGLSAKEIRPVAVTAAVAVRRYRRHYANGVYTVATTVYGRMDTVMLALLGGQSPLASMELTIGLCWLASASHPGLRHFRFACLRHRKQGARVCFG